MSEKLYLIPYPEAIVYYNKKNKEKRSKSRSKTADEDGDKDGGDGPSAPHDPNGDDDNPNPRPHKPGKPKGRDSEPTNSVDIQMHDTNLDLYIELTLPDLSNESFLPAKKHRRRRSNPQRHVDVIEVKSTSSDACVSVADSDLGIFVYIFQRFLTTDFDNAF